MQLSSFSKVERRVAIFIFLQRLFNAVFNANAWNEHFFYGQSILAVLKRLIFNKILPWRMQETRIFYDIFGDVFSPTTLLLPALAPLVRLPYTSSELGHCASGCDKVTLS